MLSHLHSVMIQIWSFQEYKFKLACQESEIGEMQWPTKVRILLFPNTADVLRDLYGCAGKADFYKGRWNPRNGVFKQTTIILKSFKIHNNVCRHSSQIAARSRIFFLWISTALANIIFSRKVIIKPRKYYL